MDWYPIFIATIGGFAAGSINTLSGNGSAITLPILTEMMGLSPNQANATNRLGVVTNAVVALGTFAKKGHWDLGTTKPFIVSATLGGFLGVWLATIVSNEFFMEVLKFMMVFMLFVVVFKPDRWIKQSKMVYQLPVWVSWPIYFMIGIYGGFIQMGMGIFFLIVMVLIGRYPVIQANIAKMLVTLLFSGFSIIVFSAKGLIHWDSGIALTIGQALGGYTTASLASRSSKAGLYAYIMLIIGICLSIVKLFDLDVLFLGWLS